MKEMFHRLSLVRYWTEEKANALAETAILFPVFLTLLMGVYDLGQGIIINQKSITASQVIADLIARNREVDMSTLNDITRAGEMAIDPFPLERNGTRIFGYDIVSVLFDEDGDPDIQWRVTEDMLPNDDPLLTVVNVLELTNEGLVIVTTEYTYTPYFAEFVTDEIVMREVSFLRGRGSSLVSCDDCPGGS